MAFLFEQIRVYLSARKPTFETMSKISFNAVVPLMVASSPADTVQTLLREIIVLQAKLDGIDKQDFYFQMGRKSHEKRLDALKAEYGRIVDLVNNHDVDYFLEQINEAEEKFQQICSRESKHPVFVKVMVDAHLNAEIAYLKMLIQAKGQYKKLTPLNQITQNQQALLEIFS